MRACWVFMILAACTLSDQSQGSCNDKLNTVCVPAGSDVPVPCWLPKPDKFQVRLNLLQDGQIISNHTCTHDTSALKCTPPHARAGVELHVNAENKSLNFTLTGVNASGHGLYRCETIVMFPPPLIEVRSDGILLLVEGHQCEKVCRNDATSGNITVTNCGYHWIWINALLSVYGVTVTFIAIFLRIKLSRTDSQSDYMNTKPKAPRERRKKRGVQNPVPRHF